MQIDTLIIKILTFFFYFENFIIFLISRLIKYYKYKYIVIIELNKIIKL